MAWKLFTIDLLTKGKPVCSTEVSLVVLGTLQDLIKAQEYLPPQKEPDDTLGFFLFHFYLICWFFSITGLLSIWFGFQFNTYGDSLFLFCLLAILWKSMRENINSGRRWRWSWKSWRMGNQDKMHLWKILKHKVNYNKKKTLDSKLEQLEWWFEVKISPLLPTYTEFSNEKSEKVFIWEWNESFVWGRWGKVS